MLPTLGTSMHPQVPQVNDMVETIVDRFSHLPYDFKPKRLHPELCRGLNETECKDFDDHARRLQQRAITTGDLNVMVLLIDIVPGRSKPPREDYEMLFNGPADGQAADPDVIPTGSIKEYFETNSYNNFRPQFYVHDWVNPGFSESYCAGANQGLNSQFADCFFPALQELEDQSFSWFEYDQNGDGFIDHLLVLHNGYNGEVGRFFHWSKLIEYRKMCLTFISTNSKQPTTKMARRRRVEFDHTLD